MIVINEGVRSFIHACLLHPRFLMPTYPVDDFSFFFGTISQFLSELVRQSPLLMSGARYAVILLRFSGLSNVRAASNSKEFFLDSDDLNFGPEGKSKLKSSRF